MNGKYQIATSMGGARYLYDENKFTMAVFSAVIGDAAYEAVKERIARDGGTLLNLDTGNYDAGSIGDLVA